MQDVEGSDTDPGDAHAEVQRVEDERVDYTLDNLLEEQLCALQNPEVANEGFKDGPFTNAGDLPAWQRAATAIVTHRDFESVIIMLTVINCVALALYSPLSPPSSPANVFMERTGM